MRDIFAGYFYFISFQILYFCLFKVFKPGISDQSSTEEMKLQNGNPSNQWIIKYRLYTNDDK